MSAADVAFIIRICLGAVLVVAATSKVRDLDSFRRAIVGYEILSPRVARGVAIGVIVAEYAVSALLLTNLFVTAAAAIATILFLAFATGIAFNLFRRRVIDCHCFGEDQAEKVSWASLLRTLALAFGGASLLAAPATSVRGAAVLADLTLAAGLVVIVRTFALIPMSWTFLRRKVPLGPSPSGRVSFHGEGLDASLRPQSGSNGLVADPSVLNE